MADNHPGNRSASGESGVQNPLVASAKTITLGGSPSFLLSIETAIKDCCFIEILFLDTQGNHAFRRNTMIGSFIKTPITKYWPSGRYKAQLNALYVNGVMTIGDALKRTEAEILRIPVCGRGTLYVLRQVLADGMREYLEEVS